MIKRNLKLLTAVSTAVLLSYPLINQPITSYAAEIPTYQDTTLTIEERLSSFQTPTDIYIASDDYYENTAHNHPTDPVIALHDCISNKPLLENQLKVLTEHGLKFKEDTTLYFNNGDTFYEPIKYLTENSAKLTLTNFGDESKGHPTFSRVRILDIKKNAEANLQNGQPPTEADIVSTANSLWTNGNNLSNDLIPNAYPDREKIWCINLINETENYDWNIVDHRFAGTKTNFQDINYSNWPEITKTQLSNNIGFIYDADNNNIYGNRVNSISELKDNFDFFNDENHLYVFCEQNPSLAIKKIYFALYDTLLGVESNTTVNGIDFKFTGGHAISGIGSDVKNIDISNCNIDYIGGSYQSTSGNRLGNGIEFYQFGSNINIHDNNISNCYDTATTLQGENGKWNNVHIYNNTFTHNSQSFEIWTKDNSDNNMMTNIKFNNNLCKEQGHGWGYNVRPDKDRAADIEIQVMDLNNWDVTLENNVFYNPRRIYYFDDTNDSTNPTYDKLENIKNNLITLNNKFYLTEPKSTDINNLTITSPAVVHSGKIQGNFDWDTQHTLPEYGVNTNIPRTITINGETVHSKYIDMYSVDNFNNFANEYNKNTNDIAYKILEENVDGNKILTSIEYVGYGQYTDSITHTSQYYIANFSPENGYSDCNEINRKVYIKSLKYPYIIYDIDTETNIDNPLKFLTSQDIKFDYDLALQTTSAAITVNKNNTVANTNYTWFVNSTNSLKNATKVDSNQISNFTETTSMTPSNETETKYYFCVASFDSDNTRTAAIVKAVEVLPSTEDGDTDNPPAEGGDTDNPPTEGGDTDNPPAEGGDTDNPPAEGGDTDNPPTEGGDIDNPPTEGGDTDNPPTEGGDTDNPPAEGGDTDNPPAEGGDTDNPPTEGGDTDNPPTEDNNNQNNTNSSGSSHHSSSSSSSNSNDVSSSSTANENPNVNSLNTEDESSYAYKYDFDLNCLIKVKINPENKDTIPDTINTSVNNLTQTIIQDNSWNKINGNQWCYIKNGTPATGWITIDNIKYHFNDKKIMDIRWVKDNNNWYYLNPVSDGTQGALKTGWVKDNNKWYYLNPSEGENKGQMKTGWINDNNNWYYLKSDGSMKTDWLYWNSKWYYLDSNGSMKTGWKKINNKWYYFYEDGSMALNTSINGYILGPDGAMR